MTMEVIMTMVMITMHDYDNGNDDDHNDDDDHRHRDFDNHHDFDNDNDHQRRSWLLPSCARLRATSRSKIFDQK